MVQKRRRRSVSQTVLVEVLRDDLSSWLQRTGRDPSRTPLEIVDVGGGTGGVAQTLVELGRVTVVDPSPDALASLERRTAEAGLVGRVRGVQGDTTNLVELLGAGSADLVVCHRTLEVVDAPADACAAMRRLLRPGGALSLVVAQRRGAVVSQALVGQVAAARAALTDEARFDGDELTALVERGGFEVRSRHGVGAVADHVAASLVEDDPARWEELRQLEHEICGDPVFRASAPWLHVWAEPV